MKKFGILLTLCLFCFCCAVPCHAAAVTVEQWESLHADELEEAAKESGAGLELDESFTLNGALAQIGAVASDTLHSAVRSATGSGAVLLLVVLFCETAEALGIAAGMEKTPASLVGVTAVTVVSAADVSSLMGLGKSAVEQIDHFSTLLIPAVTAISAASGSMTGSVARQTATVFFSDVLITLIDRVLIPFTYLYAVACAASAAVENRGLEEIAKLLKWAVTSVLTTLLIAFTGYLSLTSAAAAGADASTIKLTRTVISSVVPVVGGILSNATETVLSGVSLLKNLVGTFGVAAVLGFCVVPFLRLGAQYLMYRLVAVLSALISKGKIPPLIENIAGAFALVLGMTGTAALLVMIAIFSTLAVAVP